MTKEYGVTHFTELHRILHKYFLIRRCQRQALVFIYFIILVNPCFALYVCFFEANVHSLITPENQMPALRALGFLYVTTLANSRYRAHSSAYADGLLVKTAIKTNACHKAGACFYLCGFTSFPCPGYRLEHLL